MFFRIVSGFITICASATIAFVCFQHFNGNLRFPASIPKTKIYDFSQVDVRQIEASLRKQILGESNLVVKNQDFGITVGNFRLRDESGNAQLACDVYSSVTYTFEAEGMAVSGERPKLKVTGLCSSPSNAAALDPLWIPVNSLLQQKPQNMDLNLNDSGQTVIQFADMDMIWPMHWVLSGVTFHARTQSTSDLVIDRQDVYKYSRSPLVMYWKRSTARQ